MRLGFYSPSRVRIPESPLVELVAQGRELQSQIAALVFSERASRQRIIRIPFHAIRKLG